MIEGLKVGVMGKELRQLCEDRWNHHLERHRFYQEQIANLRDGGLDRTNMTGDPIRDLDERRKGHESKARYFAFLRDHVILEEDYRLSQADLRDLEITDRY